MAIQIRIDGRALLVLLAVAAGATAQATPGYDISWVGSGKAIGATEMQNTFTNLNDRLAAIEAPSTFYAQQPQGELADASVPDRDIVTLPIQVAADGILDMQAGGTIAGSGGAAYCELWFTVDSVSPPSIAVAPQQNGSGAFASFSLLREIPITKGAHTITLHLHRRSDSTGACDAQGVYPAAVLAHTR